MLRIYVAEDCPGSPTALRRAAALHEQAPDVPIEVIDTGAPGAIVPPAIFGTPIYTWDERILFLGNPGEQELIERVRRLREREPA